MIATLMGLDTISPKELHQLFASGALYVFDVNSPQSWMQTRVPGAVHLDPLTFSAADLPADKNARIVFYCSNTWCRKAPNAARRAAALGYTNVRVMSAGIKGWLGANLPVEGG
jgi:rhodanese-related sulfurtransferase